MPVTPGQEPPPNASSAASSARQDASACDRISVAGGGLWSAWLFRSAGGRRKSVRGSAHTTAMSRSVSMPRMARPPGHADRAFAGRSPDPPPSRRCPGARRVVAPSAPRPASAMRTVRTRHAARFIACRSRAARRIAARCALRFDASARRSDRRRVVIVRHARPRGCSFVDRRGCTDDGIGRPLPLRRGGRFPGGAAARNTSRRCGRVRLPPLD